VTDRDNTVVLDAVEDAFARVTMTTPASAIVAAGRVRRRRRRMVQVGGLAAVAAMTTGVVVQGGGGTDRDGVHIRTIAYTVDSQPDGTVVATWSKARYFADPDGLERALHQAGFPVRIESGRFCAAPGASDDELDASGVGAGVREVMRGQEHDGDVTFTFDPAAVPEGHELFIGYLTEAQRAASGHVGSIERLVPADIELTCTDEVPRLG